jgi:hypothetical protein
MCKLQGFVTVLVAFVYVFHVSKDNFTVSLLSSERSIILLRVNIRESQNESGHSGSPLQSQLLRRQRLGGLQFKASQGKKVSESLSQPTSLAW